MIKGLDMYEDINGDKPHALLDDDDKFDDSCNYGYESRD